MAALSLHMTHTSIKTPPAQHANPAQEPVMPPTELISTTSPQPDAAHAGTQPAPNSGVPALSGPVATAPSAARDGANGQVWAKSPPDLPCPPIEWALAYFWPKVLIGDGCWIWTAALSTNGYGVMDIGGRRGRLHRAARVSLWLETGEWPFELQACHRCDNAVCVRPDHLYWGSMLQNARDSFTRGRKAVTGRSRHRLAGAADDLYDALEEAVGVLSDLYDGKSVLGRVLDAIDTGNAALRMAK